MNINTMLKNQLSSKITEAEAKIPTGTFSTAEKTVFVPLSELSPNPYQPRIELKAEELEELSSSIRNNGLLQPIIVAKYGDGFIIVAGHRRAKAHEMLGLKEIKATIIDYDENKLSALAIIENLQRENLQPLEMAMAFKSLIDSKIATNQEDISSILSVSSAKVSQYLSILKLPNEIQKRVKTREYTDVTVLSAISRLKSKDEMINCFNTISSNRYSQKEALDYISMIKNSLKKESTKRVVNAGVIQFINNRAKLQLDINKFTTEQKELFDRFIELLDKSSDEG